MLSHTPFRDLATELSQRRVVVAGRKQSAAVAKHYGYHDMVTTCELAEAFPHSVPFSLSLKGMPCMCVCMCMCMCVCVCVTMACIHLAWLMEMGTTMILYLGGAFMRG